MMQPHFLPWMGYLELLDAADVFVFLDTFELSRQSWSTRNQILLRDGRRSWISVELDHSISVGATFLEAREHPSRAWRRRAISKIKENYRNAPFISEVLSDVEPWLANQHQSISDLCWELLEVIRMRMGTTTEVVRSSELKDVPSERGDRLRNLMMQVGADRYLAAAGSVGYMTKDPGWQGVDVRIQNHQAVGYPQKNSQVFVPNLSFIDVVANVGWFGMRSVLKGTEAWNPMS